MFKRSGISGMLMVSPFSTIPEENLSDLPEVLIQEGRVWLKDFNPLPVLHSVFHYLIRAVFILLCYINSSFR